jgi:formylglycine-generating enzyme required for sulfatase activity/serine/threonine protein kinase
MLDALPSDLSAYRHRPAAPGPQETLMPPGPPLHPSDDLLAALNSGRLDEATARAVRAHLETCPKCRGRAALSQKETLPPARPPPEAPAVPPELRGLTQYADIRRLGGGGMGVVYLARNRLMDRPEVLKMVHPRLDDTEAAERFLREIRAAARLDHPNIVRAYTAFQAGERIVFVMEYVAGENLDRVVKAHGPLPVAEACRYARQVALGLEHAWEKGLVHRDIKPGNLILAPGGVVKILDFGLAKATREQAGADDLTGPGEALGTLAYMAPEQARDAATADVRADLYSLGCTLYCLLAGRPPFHGRSQLDLLRAHQEDTPGPLHQVRGDVPAELAAVVAKLLAKEPGRRYQQPAEAARALEPFLQEKGQTCAPPSPSELANTTTVEDRNALTRPPEEAPTVKVRPPAWRWSLKWWLGIAVGLVLAPALGLLAVDGLGLWRLWIPAGEEGAAEDGRPIQQAPPGSQPEKKAAADRPMGEKPPPAQAPSSAARARELQQAWARSLGRQAEEKVDLGGGVALDLVLIPPGAFVMGSPADEKEHSRGEAAHPVTITKPFYMGKFPVTQEQYAQITGGNPSWFSKGGGGKAAVAGLDTRPFPVEQVSWADATAFCAKLAEWTGRKARLPSEAEWEYACRAGTTTPFHFGPACNGTQANGNGNFPYGTAQKGPYLERASPVGAYPPNAWGLFDMHGNVWQWCRDWYEYDLADLGAVDPVRAERGSQAARVLRGGSWYDQPGSGRAAYRGGFAPAGRRNDTGFRVVFPLE